MNFVKHYQIEIEKLFQEWKRKPPSNEIDHINGVFIRDGIVCPETWFTQTVCPLFLLKEAFHGDGDWDLISDHLLGSKKIGRGTSTSSMEQVDQYAEYDCIQLRREIELIDPTVIICGYTISSLNIIMEKKIKDYQKPNPNLYYFTELNGHNVIVLDYYHPSNRYPAILNYYGLMGIYQQALIHQKKEHGADELT